MFTSCLIFISSERISGATLRQSVNHNAFLILIDTLLVMLQVSNVGGTLENIIQVNRLAVGDVTDAHAVA